MAVESHFVGEDYSYDGTYGLQLGLHENPRYC